MDAVVFGHAAAAVLLIVAGAAKMRRPSSAAELIRLLRIANPGPKAASVQAVVLGMVEVSLGVAALAVGGPWTAAAVGVLYVLFAVAALGAIRTGAPSCGCFGRVDTAPSWIHVAGNAALAAASFAAISRNSPVEVADGQRAGGFGFVLGVGLLAGVFARLFTAAPEALSARRTEPGSSR